MGVTFKKVDLSGRVYLYFKAEDFINYTVEYPI